MAVIDAFIVEKSKYREQIGAVEVASRLTCDNVINLKLSYTQGEICVCVLNFFPQAELFSWGIFFAN